MNHSLYLLLTPPVEPEASGRVISPTEGKTHRYPSAALNLVQSGAALHQASRSLSAPETRHSLSTGTLGFVAHVVLNSVGFLLMISGLLLLLHIAQVSLS